MRHVVVALAFALLLSTLHFHPNSQAAAVLSTGIFGLTVLFAYVLPFVFWVCKRLVQGVVAMYRSLFGPSPYLPPPRRFSPAGARRPWPTTAEALAGLRWDEVERVLEVAYARWGWKVERTGTSAGVRQGRHGGDGGVDLVLRRAGDLCLVSSKHWKGRVGVKEVRELFGLMAHHGATRGVVVGTGGFTDEAWRFVKGKPIDLITGRRLTELLAGPAETQRAA